MVLYPLHSPRMVEAKRRKLSQACSPEHHRPPREGVSGGMLLHHSQSEFRTLDGPQRWDICHILTHTQLMRSVANLPMYIHAVHLQRATGAPTCTEIHSI